MLKCKELNLIQPIEVQPRKGHSTSMVPSLNIFSQSLAYSAACAHATMPAEYCSFSLHVLMSSARGGDVQDVHPVLPTGWSGSMPHASSALRRYQLLNVQGCDVWDRSMLARAATWWPHHGTPPYEASYSALVLPRGTMQGSGHPVAGTIALTMPDKHSMGLIV